MRTIHLPISDRNFSSVFDFFLLYLKKEKLDSNENKIILLILAVQSVSISIFFDQKCFSSLPLLAVVHGAFQLPPTTAIGKNYLYTDVQCIIRHIPILWPDTMRKQSEENLRRATLSGLLI